MPAACRFAPPRSAAILPPETKRRRFATDAAPCPAAGLQGGLAAGAPRLGGCLAPKPRSAAMLSVSSSVSTAASSGGDDLKLSQCSLESGSEGSTASGDRPRAGYYPRVSYGDYDDACMAGGGDTDCGEARDLAGCQPVHLAWREAEGRTAPQYWMVSFECEAVEQLRLSCMESIVKYIHRRQLDAATMHLTAHLTNRLFAYYVSELQVAASGNYQCLVTAAGASLRTAVKMHERLHHVDAFRSRPNHLWQDLEMNDAMQQLMAACLGRGATASSANWKQGVELLNQVERTHLQILDNEAGVHTPVAPDFLDQYLRVGGWPAEAVVHYRNLALFVLARALFITGKSNTLRGVPPSRLAAGALVLAVKIINSHCTTGVYEFWTAKLERFSQYSMKEIQPVVQSLSRMLRKNETPNTTEVLRRMFPDWAGYSWC